LAKIYTARQVGDLLEIPHLEVIRRIRRNDIEGKKLGWNWVITDEAVEKAKKADWYNRHLARKTATAE